MLKQLRKSLARFISNSMSLPLSKQFARLGNRAMTPDWSEVMMSDKDHYTGMAYAAIQNRANTTATIAKDNLHTVSNIKDFTHPYLTLIRESTNFSEFWFWIWVSVFLDLEGVVYILAVRNVTTSKSRYGDIQYLKLLNPYHIQKVLNKDSLEVEGYIETRNGMQRSIPPHMIIEIKELNPIDEESAYARSDAAKESQFALKSANDYTRASLKGNINAPGILTTGVILEDEMFVNFQNSVRKHRKGEPVFSNGPGAITWTDMQVDLNKAGLKDVNESNIQVLLSIYGMSKTTMGIEQSGTTRETARVQEGLLAKMHIVPRIQLVLDAFNQDYKVKYPEQYNSNKALITVDNPANVDKEAEKSDAEVKKMDFELYQSLINKGYKSDLASQYVSGDIGVEGLGEPTEQVREQESDEEALGNMIRKLAKNQIQLVESQQAVLENAIINIDEQLAIKAINRIPKLIKKENAINSESDLITAFDKRLAENELRVVLSQFYNTVFVLEGTAHTTAQKKELDLDTGSFVLDDNIKNIIKLLSDKVSNSHIDTVSNELYETAREGALADKSQQQIIRDLKSKFSYEISSVRARAVARTETQRSFTLSQLEADKQLAQKNGFVERAYKKWTTNSLNPCPICISLASEDPIPLFDNFRDFGSDVKYSEGGKRKSFKVNFTDLDAGCAHPNCACNYTLIIEKEKVK